MEEMAPRPKSPPDVCGKHRLQVAVQSLDKEIHFLKGELHSLEGIGPAYRGCKEVNEFVGNNTDPFIKVYEKRNKSCCIWKILRAMLCCNLASACCFETPKCHCVQLKKKNSCCNYCMNCVRCNCCNLDPWNCPECSCGCVCSCSRCVETCFCPFRLGYCCRCIC